MGRDVQTLVRSLDNLNADQPQITFVGEGTEVNSILSLETIQKGAYYYQVPVSGDRFSKYLIKDNKNHGGGRTTFPSQLLCLPQIHACLDR